MIKFAVSLQLFFFVIEYVVLRFYWKRTYPWRQAFRSLVIAIPAFVIWDYEYSFIAPLTVWVTQFAIYPLGSNYLSWALCFLAAEFHFYFLHRNQHRISWLWADHRVHHSTTDLNLFDGNRLGWTVYFAFGYLSFLLPFAYLGLPFSQLITCSNLILLYQFFLHTQAIPRLGPLERIFNTPSNHRVHHASNKEYLDCNYGGITMAFDWLFGTYVAEKDSFVIFYGLAETNVESQPLWKVLFGGWIAIWNAARESKNPVHWLKYCFGPPGDLAPSKPLPFPDKSIAVEVREAS